MYGAIFTVNDKTAIKNIDVKTKVSNSITLVAQELDSEFSLMCYYKEEMTLDEQYACPSVVKELPEIPCPEKKLYVPLDGQTDATLGSYKSVESNKPLFWTEEAMFLERRSFIFMNEMFNSTTWTIQFY